MRPGLRSQLAATIATSLLLAGGTAAAAGPVDAVLACSSLTEARERLACYDRTVPGLRQAAPAVAPVPAVPATPATPATPQTAEQRFGAERLRDSAAPAPETADRISAKVVSVRNPGNGRLVLTLDNGQVWALRESGAPSVRAGTPVVIEAALFGSYNVKFDGLNRFFKAARVQ